MINIDIQEISRLGNYNGKELQCLFDLSNISPIDTITEMKAWRRLWEESTQHVNIKHKLRASNIGFWLK